MALGKTARFYRKNRESYLKKLAQANTHPVWGEQKKKRKDKKVDSARKRRKKNHERKNNGQAPLPKTVHYDHKTNSFISEEENTGQAEASRLKGSKRAARKKKREMKKQSRRAGKSIKRILSVFILSLLVVSCSPEWHVMKAYKKGFRFAPDTVNVQIHDTVTLDGKDSIIIREFAIPCPAPEVPKTRWRVRFDNKRFKDSLKYYDRQHKRETNAYRDSLKQARKMNKQDNITERVVVRQENKGSLWWLWLAIGAAIMLVIRYLYNRFKGML
jgi:hypothetical protein